MPKARKKQHFSTWKLRLPFKHPALSGVLRVCDFSCTFLIFLCVCVCCTPSRVHGCHWHLCHCATTVRSRSEESRKYHTTIRPGFPRRAEVLISAARLHPLRARFTVATLGKRGAVSRKDAVGLFYSSIFPIPCCFFFFVGFVCYHR